MSDYLRRIVARSTPPSEDSPSAITTPFGPSFSMVGTSGAAESPAGADFEEVDEEVVAEPLRSPAAFHREAAPSRAPMEEIVAPRPIVSRDSGPAIARSIAEAPARTVAPRRPIEPVQPSNPHAIERASFETSAIPTPPIIPSPNVASSSVVPGEPMNPQPQPWLPLEPPAFREEPTPPAARPTLDTRRSTDRETKIVPPPAIEREVLAPKPPSADAKTAPAIADALARVDRLLLPREPATPSIAPPPSEGPRVSIGTIRVEVVHSPSAAPSFPTAPAARRMPPRAPRLGAPASKLRFGLGQG